MGVVVRVGLKTFKAPYTGRALNSSEETRDNVSINISSRNISTGCSQTPVT